MCFITSMESVIAGVHEARISISDSSFRGESFPKDALDTRVTVPLGAARAHSSRSRASRNQLQPTSGRRGSCCMTGSTSARTKVTQRNSPSHVSCPPGSCNKTKRPEAISSSSSPSNPLLTSAEKAKAYVANFCGAGTSSKTISARGVKARKELTNSSNPLASTD